MPDEIAVLLLRALAENRLELMSLTS